MSSSAKPPPFYWKVPVAEKDYMYENYRRIRQIGNQSQQKRNEPMKAAFIPGVTKNSKYSHVTSRVGESLRTQAQKSAEDISRSRAQSSTSVKTLPSRYKCNGKPIEPPVMQTVTVTGAGGRRLSRSFADLSIDHLGSDSTARKGLSVSANGQSQPSRRKNQPLRPEEESVYNWRFSDSPSQPQPEFVPGKHHEKQQKCHRVEYLPCDGICADEAVVDDKSNDSARSTTSSRTSRGCNTEETRIIQDQGLAPGFYRQRSQSLEHDQDIEANDNYQLNDDGDYDKGNFTQSREHNAKETYSSNVNRSNRFSAKPAPAPNPRQQFVRSNSMMAPKLNKNGPINGKHIPDKPETPNYRTNGSSIASILKNSSNSPNQAGGELPHSLGTVPKYLKQRQEEWRVEEQAKREAEKNANVPTGHVLMSETERVETLTMLKKNYDSLIVDLNRIPIRIDTIRVRDHRIDLEKQLAKLEEAMRIFSRPRVFVKMDK